uniref:Uncharacterized protein n=1 Tax=Anguilla anguilla TaxID=7936 RepID=A0A0E9WAT4_ANGAN
MSWALNLFYTTLCPPKWLPVCEVPFNYACHPSIATKSLNLRF